MSEDTSVSSPDSKSPAEKPIKVEPPYGVIWKLLNAGQVVPFLGAGASIVGRSANAHWDPKQPVFLPSGTELSNFLAKETSFPASDPHDVRDLAKVSSYYADVSGRRVLRDQLHKVFGREYEPGRLHYFLASIQKPLVIVVTNYDTLLEQAFIQAEKPYDLVIYPAEHKKFANSVLWWKHGEDEPQCVIPNTFADIDLDKTTVIFKMHGTVDPTSIFKKRGADTPSSNKWDNFVITEEDYVEFLSRMTASTAVPALFSEPFAKRSFLFLGYSLNDWNLRVLLRNLNNYFLLKRSDDDDEPLYSWAIQRDPSVLALELWKRRKVSIFNQTIDEFVTRVQETT